VPSLVACSCGFPACPFFLSQSGMSCSVGLDGLARSEGPFRPYSPARPPEIGDAPELPEGGVFSFRLQARGDSRRSDMTAIETGMRDASRVRRARKSLRRARAGEFGDASKGLSFRDVKSMLVRLKGVVVAINISRTMGPNYSKNAFDTTKMRDFAPSRYPLGHRIALRRRPVGGDEGRCALC
jgi:hypothetical protein